MSAQIIPLLVSPGPPAKAGGEVERAQRLALRASFGEPLEQASQAVLIDLALCSPDPEIRAAAEAELRRPR